jgi:C1A family cysteine protease
MTTKRRYNWKPDLPDHRDFVYQLASITLPSKVDLRPLCSPVEDQGNLGSCTGNALVGAMEVLENIEKASFVDLSRLFVYYNERAMEGTIRQDAGAVIRDGVKTLVKSGVCTEKLWPYNIAKFKNKPTKPCFTDGLTRTVSMYSRLNTTTDMRNCLAAGFPFVFGFSVYDSFESDAVAKTGVVPMPGKSEQLLGGHAVLAVGYDDTTQHFIVRNSWGAGWGDKGYFTIPYAYLAGRNLSDDFWTIRK